MVLNVIKKRRSYRLYTSKQVSNKFIKDLLRAAMFAPSAKNQRPCEFIILKKPKIFVSLTKWTKSLETAPLAIAIVADKNKSGHWVEDCSVAAENLMLQATALGLGTCWVQVHGSSTKTAEPKLKKMLRLPKRYGILCLMAIGYPAIKKPAHKNSEFKLSKVYNDFYKKGAKKC